MPPPNNLLQLANKIHANEESLPRKIILFGAPGSAKTHIAATIAKVPSITRIFWFDAENGIETVIYAKDSQGRPLLTNEQMAKIIPIRIEDTKELPRFAETALKTFTAQRGVTIDAETGVVLGDIGVNSINGSGIPLNIFTLTDSDAIVIDSLSQLADSVITLANNTLDLDKPDARRIFGQANPDLGAILSGIQATKATVVVCTHTIDITKVVNKGTKQEYEKLLQTVPMCGSRPFSNKVGKYFGYKIYTYVDGTTYKATCKVGKIEKVQVASRRPISFEGDLDPSLEKIFFSEEEEQKATEQAKTNPVGIKIPTISITIPSKK
jgi:hypothetical protein